MKEIRNLLLQCVKPQKATFFKTGAGDYGEHDRFMGVSVPHIRKIAKQFAHLSLDELQILIESPFNEERLLALIILVNCYQKTKDQALYTFYIKNLKHVNNWNLVDASAHLILGAHLFERDKNILIELSKSQKIWEKRISIVSTWYFIRQNDTNWTFKLVTMMLGDKHDLIHKASGWMLREAGKRDPLKLRDFLDKYAKEMPRTMLRYAIEKLPLEERKIYMSIT